MPLHTLRFKVGDKVRLIDRILGYDIGTETTIVEVTPDGLFPYRLDLQVQGGFERFGIGVQVSGLEIEAAS